MNSGVAHPSGLLFGPTKSGKQYLSVYYHRQANRLPESGALMVRTFPRSKRLQNIVAIVDESGVFLVSLFDESEFEKKFSPRSDRPKFEEYPPLEEDHP